MEMFLPLTSKADSKPKPLQPMTESEMKKYVGIYRVPNRLDTEIVIKDGKLLMKEFGAEMPLTKIGENRFSFQFPGDGNSEEIVFKIGDDGKPIYLHHLVWAFKRVPATKKSN